MSTQLFATIKRTSKYAHQQMKDSAGKPIKFEIVFHGHWNHGIRGNDNNYSLEDLNVYVKCNNGEFVRLS